MRGIQPSHQIIRIVQLLLGHGCLTWFDYSHEKHKQKIEETMLQYLTSPRSTMCIIHYSNWHCYLHRHEKDLTIVSASVKNSNHPRWQIRTQIAKASSWLPFNRGTRPSQPSGRHAYNSCLGMDVSHGLMKDMRKHKQTIKQQQE